MKMNNQAVGVMSIDTGSYQTVISDQMLNNKMRYGIISPKATYQNAIGKIGVKPPRTPTVKHALSSRRALSKPLSGAQTSRNRRTSSRKI